MVLVDLWTYGCINCCNALLHVREWHRKYKGQGLVVVGMHAPEFAFEKNINNLKRAIGELDVEFPVAIDNNYAIWRAFKTTNWPAHYSSMPRVASVFTTSVKASTKSQSK